MGRVDFQVNFGPLIEALAALSGAVETAALEASLFSDAARPFAWTLMRDHNRDEAESMCYRLALAAIGTRHEAAYAKAAEHMPATE